MPPEARFAVHHFQALGTTCSLFGVGLRGTRLRVGELWVRKMGARMTRFSTTSELARVNATAGRWTEISPEMSSVLATALRAFESSSGLVNIAILPSLLAAGYVQPLVRGAGTPSLGDARPSPPLPEVVELRGNEVRVRSGCGLDLGGVAKGWMADRLCEWLGPNVLANIGGDLMATGPGPDGIGWPVGMSSATLMLCDQGAATSSVCKRRWGADLHHLIDPRTGLPANTGLAEVSVVAATGVAAEVIAKTALLLGPAMAPAFCAANALAWWLRDSRDN